MPLPIGYLPITEQWNSCSSNTDLSPLRKRRSSWTGVFFFALFRAKFRNTTASRASDPRTIWSSMGSRRRTCLGPDPDPIRTRSDPDPTLMGDLGAQIFWATIWPWLRVDGPAWDAEDRPQFDASPPRRCNRCSAAARHPSRPGAPIRETVPIRPLRLEASSSPRQVGSESISWREKCTDEAAVNGSRILFAIPIRSGGGGSRARIVRALSRAQRSIASSAGRSSSAIRSSAESC